MRRTRMAEYGGAGEAAVVALYHEEEDPGKEEVPTPPAGRKPRKRHKKKPPADTPRKASRGPAEVEAQPMSQFDAVRCFLCGVVLLPRMGRRGPGVFCECKGFRDE